ncbi:MULTISPECIES: YqjK-like family protein [Modicisalibacter]|uniref:YqjK-like family protein n=1 Tax=Modicisalibacter tunisiensis TaxID=390637 RepID=A0ABS7X367_9GAMM|nr:MULTISPECIES: YqjK-like family protein [Modicisalibacter]MBZ9568854.1 YqjK-like family protein [Modicisalibacter tunisiensis]
MTHRERLAYRERLDAQILQQRLDMGMALRDWREATAPIDHGWQKLMRWRAPTLAALGLVSWRTLRRPRSAGRLTRRLMTGLLLANRLRAVYRSLHRH